MTREDIMKKFSATNPNEPGGSFPKRIDRLSAVYDCLNGIPDNTILKLHDHKGNLIVLWRKFVEHYKWKNEIEDAWRRIGHEDMVIHLFQDRDREEDFLNKDLSKFFYTDGNEKYFPY